MKIFTSFEDSTICLLYLLNYCFSSVHVFKPCTSKSGNSEVYVICLQYQKKRLSPNILDVFIQQYKNREVKAMFPIEYVPDDFINQIKQLSSFFMNEQIKTINHNVFHFNKHIKSEILRVGIIRNDIAQFFLSKYKVRAIPDTDRLVPNKNIQLKTIFRISKGTYITDFIDNVNELDIVLGRQIVEVCFSQFCDMDLIEKLGFISNLQLSSNAYVKSLVKMDIFVDPNYHSHISYNCDNRTYIKFLFTELNTLLKNLTHSTDVLLTGYLFLTRLEVGLLYLFMSCFTSIDYFENGIIYLRNCNGSQLPKIIKFFNEISNNFFNMKLPPIVDDSSIVLSVLNVVHPSYLYDGAFQKELRYYNRTTINVGLRENDLLIV